MLIGSALLAGQLLRPDAGWLMTGLSLLPAILAVIAAATIGLPQRETIP